MRRAVAITGVLAAVAGWAAVVFDLFGPTYSGGSCNSADGCVEYTASLVQVGLTGTAALFLTAVALLFFGIGLGSLLAATQRKAVGVVLLAICVVALLAATLVSGFSVGASFLPADMLAIVTLVLAVTRRRRPTGPIPEEPRQ
jgi:hypothetical protein